MTELYVLLTISAALAIALVARVGDGQEIGCAVTVFPIFWVMLFFIVSSFFQFATGWNLVVTSGQCAYKECMFR